MPIDLRMPTGFLEVTEVPATFQDWVIPILFMLGVFALLLLAHRQIVREHEHVENAKADLECFD